MELKDIKKEVEFREAREALALYKRGYTLREIAKTMNLSHETIRTRINALLKVYFKGKVKLTGLDKRF